MLEILPSLFFRPAQQPGLSFPDRGIQFLSSRTGRECAAQVHTHRPTDWDAMDWVRCVRSRLERTRNSTCVRDEEWRVQTRADGPRLERHLKGGGGSRITHIPGEPAISKNAVF